ncbi:MAG: ABC transporter permease [Betaproteobacteria bacterium]|nr:ABC transporter permease [Betaproteobacteria bacterium]
MSQRTLARVVSWLVIPLLLVAWQATVMSNAVSPRLLPDLRLVADTLVSDILTGRIPLHAAVSVGRALSGFMLAVMVGTVLGYAIARSRIVDILIEPTFIAGYPVPKIALFPVFTFIFGIGTIAKIAFTFLECVYPITIATILAVRNVEQRIVWTALSMGAGRFRIFARVLLPAALPGIFSGLRVALPISMIVVILTEMLGDSLGLGHYIAISSASFRADQVFAGLIAVGVCGFALDRVLILIGERVIPSQRHAIRS